MVVWDEPRSVSLLQPDAWQCVCERGYAHCRITDLLAYYQRTFDEGHLHKKKKAKKEKVDPTFVHRFVYKVCVKREGQCTWRQQWLQLLPWCSRCLRLTGVHVPRHRPSRPWSTEAHVRNNHTRMCESECEGARGRRGCV